MKKNIYSPKMSRVFGRSADSFGIMALAGLIAPNVTFAANGYCSGGLTPVSGSSTIAAVLKYGTCLVSNLAVPTLGAVAVAAFVWGVVKYMGSQTAEKRKEGKQYMIWGVVGLALLLSVWTFVTILGKTFSLQNSSPTVQKPGTIQ